MSVDGLLADGFMCMGLFMFPGICKNTVVNRVSLIVFTFYNILVALT